MTDRNALANTVCSTVAHCDSELIVCALSQNGTYIHHCVLLGAVCYCVDSSVEV